MTPVQVCSIEECGRATLARGWCGKHYQRWVSSGEAGYNSPPNQRKAKFPIRVPTDPALVGYIAGLIDGEGCIRLHQQRHPGYANESYSPQLQIGMTYQPLLDWLVEHVGGRYVRHRRKDGSKDLYNWRIHGPNTVTLLRATYPYLVVKRAQADVIFEFAVTGTTVGEWEGRGQSADLLERRRALKERLRVLNRKGEHE